MMSFWNPGQKALIGQGFVPENQEPHPFGVRPLPWIFNVQGNAFRTVGPDRAVQPDSQQRVCFGVELLVYPQASGPSIPPHLTLNSSGRMWSPSHLNGHVRGH